MTRAESAKSLLSRFFAPELRAWRGHMALPVVFWGYGVTISLALAMLHGTALDAGQLVFQQVLILITVAYTIWILVAIWRCAPNSDPFWGALAQWLTIPWGLNTASVLFFLELELVLRYAWG
jgi:hypothetical protein